MADHLFQPPPKSRDEAIVYSTITGQEYTAPPESRIEDLLIQLKEAIEAGGGGGGFVPTDEQFNAINSGIDSTKVAQIATNTEAIEDNAEAIAEKYEKPSTGIPKTDLETAVQTSLGKADTALQSFTETDPTVPEWAKASTKPSYTQDDIADGTTYKRVSQSEKDAWSGKQNALSTTQMQAVNSGITSEGVAQISTNKENILSVANRTVKNLLNIMNTPSGTSQGITFVNNGDQSYTITGTSTSNDAYIDLMTLEAPFPEWLTAGTELGLRCSNSTARLIVIPRINGQYQASVYAGVTDLASWVVPQNMDRLHIRFKVSDVGASVNDNNVRGMICYKSLGKIDNSLVPGALPNHELTRLEAEDRVALAEVVDSWAKNLLDFANATVTDTNTTSTKTSTAVTVTNSTAMYGNSRFSLSVPKGTYTLSFKVSSASIASGSRAVVEVYSNSQGSGAPLGGINVTANGEYSFNFESTNATYYVLIYPSRDSQVSANTVTISDWMCCTKAAWEVSQKFVPYRPSYQELYERLLALENQ